MSFLFVDFVFGELNLQKVNHSKQIRKKKKTNSQLKVNHFPWTSRWNEHLNDVRSISPPGFIEVPQIPQ